ncbi:MAG: hypothetical protein LUD81_01365 [Clostridiales bacterium]|nr:hypothetical protein [Clostridiales bacterium]
MEWTDKPWERQKGESEKAYEAFGIYRDLGNKRTVSAVVKELEKSRSLIDRWKDKYFWEERVLIYDNELEKEAKAQAVKERKEMIKRHIDMSVEVQDKSLKAFRALSILDMTPKDIKEFMKFAIELERLNRADIEEKTSVGSGEPTEDINNYSAQVNIYLPKKEDENC